MRFATVDDVVACYRLLLLREPDDAGLKNFSQLVASGGYPLEDLVSLFLGSPEFAANQAARQRRAQLIREIPMTGRLAGHRMAVAPNWNNINAEIAATGTYEPHLTQHVCAHVVPNSVFVDIGANVGYYSVLAGLLGAKVWAFEPHVRNVWLLQKNAHINRLQINIVPQALADEERLMIYDPIAGNGAISPLGEGLPPEGQQLLRTTTLDSVLSHEKKVDVIKIDVEGAEGLVMLGAKHVLAKRPLVFSEFSPNGIKAVSGIDPLVYLEMFKDYSLAVISADGTLHPASARDMVEAANRSTKGFVDLMATPST